MAFSTEFVMGAGGAGVEEIPVSMSGGGGTSSSPTVYPLTTVDAGAGALIVLAGTLNPASTSALYRPHLNIGDYLHEQPNAILVGHVPGSMIGGKFIGTVKVDILSRYASGTTTFDGTVYVARL